MILSGQSLARPFPALATPPRRGRSRASPQVTINPETTSARRAARKSAAAQARARSRPARDDPARVAHQLPSPGPECGSLPRLPLPQRRVAPSRRAAARPAKVQAASHPSSTRPGAVRQRHPNPDRPTRRTQAPAPRRCGRAPTISEVATRTLEQETSRLRSSFEADKTASVDYDGPWRKCSRRPHAGSMPERSQPSTRHSWNARVKATIRSRKAGRR